MSSAGLIVLDSDEECTCTTGASSSVSAPEPLPVPTPVRLRSKELAPHKPKRQRVRCDPSDDKLPCEICGNLFASHQLLVHQATHVGPDTTAHESSPGALMTEIIPCEICGELLPAVEYQDHVRTHNTNASSSSATAASELLPCEICGRLVLMADYAAHTAGHAEERSKELDLASFHTPEAMAARWVEALRVEAEAPDQNNSGSPRLPRGSVANFDLAVCFMSKALHMYKQLGTSFAEPRIVFHWTPRKNFSGIIDGNLCVPDGRSVFHKTDRGFYGAGIYTSPDPAYSTAYAYGDGACFVCIALPGRQFPTTGTDGHGPYFGKPCCQGYDSHVSADRSNMEWVFFSSEQLLPCYIADANSLQLAHSVTEKVRQAMVKDFLAASSAGSTPHASGSGGRPVVDPAGVLTWLCSLAGW